MCEREGRTKNDMLGGENEYYESGGKLDGEGEEVARNE